MPIWPHHILHVEKPYTLFLVWAPGCLLAAIRSCPYVADSQIGRGITILGVMPTPCGTNQTSATLSTCNPHPTYPHLYLRPPIDLL